MAKSAFSQAGGGQVGVGCQGEQTCFLCFSLQPMTAYRPILLKQNANEGCNSCASVAGLVLSFIACFILLVITP